MTHFSNITVIGKFIDISFHFYISPETGGNVTGWVNRKTTRNARDHLKIAIVATTRLENAKVVISTVNNPGYMNETL